MTRKVNIVLAATVLVVGIASAATGFAQSPTTNTPAQPAPTSSAPQGQGMMSGNGMMNGNGQMTGNGMAGGMMGMMTAMTRMANTCNNMMESAAHSPATPGKPSANTSHG